MFDDFGTIVDILTLRESLHHPKGTKDTSRDIETQIGVPTGHIESPILTLNKSIISYKITNKSI